MTRAAKKRPRIGDEAWEVEWVSKLAFYEGTQDVWHDRCEYSFRHFPNRGLAMAFAKKVWPDAKKTFGVVEITPIRFVPYDDDDAAMYPHVGYWEHSGDTEYVSDSELPEHTKPE